MKRVFVKLVKKKKRARQEIKEADQGRETLLSVRT